MFLFSKKQGFTLIELMVVIVIIGVLASLAIPRFSEASDKAKVAEAPRILASFESAYLTAKAELGDSIGSMGDVIFDTSALTSRWFNYNSKMGTNRVQGFAAATKNKIGKLGSGTVIATCDSSYANIFLHGWKSGTPASTYADAKKYVPNFLTTAANPSGGGCNW